MLRSCDTMVALGSATKHGQTIFAKNSDRPSNECQPLVQLDRHYHEVGTLTGGQFVQVPEESVTYRHVGSRPHWCWGYEHGFNEHQVVIGNEGLRSKIQHQEPKLLGMEILRLGLERGRTATEAVDVMTDCITRFGQGVFEQAPQWGNYDNGYIVADPREAYIVEAAGHHWAVKRIEQTAGISNIYSIEIDWDRLSPDAQAYAVARRWWQPGSARFNFAEAFSMAQFRAEGIAHGARRRLRSCSVLAQHTGQIEATTMMALLSDHSNGTFPDQPYQTNIDTKAGICYHYDLDAPDTSGNTAASLVADLCADGSRLPVYWCSFYSPCLGVFLPVFIEGDLPGILSIGSADPLQESPWWLFHRLSRVARAEPEVRIPWIRAQWAGLQARFLETAYPVACEGRRLMERRQTESAAQLLSRYMEESVSEALTMLKRMLREFS